jgi:type I restriction enzyme M protein
VAAETEEPVAAETEVVEQRLDVSRLEQWLWDAACQIRGPLDAPKFKDYILPLIFLKRLSDVYEDELDRLGAEFGSRDLAERLVREDHKLVRFFLPDAARWQTILEKGTDLGEHLTDAVRAVARENPRLQGVVDSVDFNATTAGQRVIDDGRLAALIQKLNKHRLGLDDVEPDILGRAYEYLLRKFAEGQGQSAGEFYTPREVAVLIARLLVAPAGATVYDPCCGSGGLLIKCHLDLLRRSGVIPNGSVDLPSEVAPLHLYGQELNPSTFAIARMNMFIYGMQSEIALGDTMNRPAFTEQAKLKTFDRVAANPMWNQDFSVSTYENDSYDRFENGYPPTTTADWGWIQHMFASLAPGGRMAVVLDTGAVSRGSGNAGTNREREIRGAFVEAGLVEGVILLPENLFYNTPNSGVIVLICDDPRDDRPITLVDASSLFQRERPKNVLTPDHVDSIADAYLAGQQVDGLTAVVSIAMAKANDYDLSPTRYVSGGVAHSVAPIDEAVMLLREAEAERTAAAAELARVLTALQLDVDDA